MDGSGITPETLPCKGSILLLLLTAQYTTSARFELTYPFGSWFSTLDYFIIVDQWATNCPTTSMRYARFELTSFGLESKMIPLHQYLIIAVAGFEPAHSVRREGLSKYIFHEPNGIAHAIRYCYKADEGTCTLGWLVTGQLLCY